VLTGTWVAAYRTRVGIPYSVCRQAGSEHGKQIWIDPGQHSRQGYLDQNLDIQRGRLGRGRHLQRRGERPPAAAVQTLV
jgi:hypothetical protein